VEEAATEVYMIDLFIKYYYIYRLDNRLAYRIDSNQKQVQCQNGSQFAITRLSHYPLHNGYIRLGFGQSSSLIGIGLVHGLANVLHANSGVQSDFLMLLFAQLFAFFMLLTL